MMASFPENITPILRSIVEVILNYGNQAWNEKKSRPRRKRDWLQRLSLRRRKPSGQEEVLQVNPDFFKTRRRILDAGTGFGKYGLLLRECFLSLQSEAGDLTPNDVVTIDGLDSSPYFIKWFKDKNIYHHYHACDLFELTKEQLSAYDLILLIDVVEHHAKVKIIDWYRQNGLRNKLFVSTPKQTIMYTERHYESDPHISQWDDDDFRTMNDGLQDFSTEQSWIFRL